MNSTPRWASDARPGSDLAGAAADDRRHRGGVVRRLQRRPGHQRPGAVAQRARHRVHRGDLERCCRGRAAGSSPGSRSASIVLPAPGGPVISRWCPPAAATSSSVARGRLAQHVGEVRAVLRVAVVVVAGDHRRVLGELGLGQLVTPSPGHQPGQGAHTGDPHARHQRRLGRVGRRHHRPRRPRREPPRPPPAARRAPAGPGRPGPARRAAPRRRTPAAAPPPAPSRMAAAMREVEARAALRQAGRREVDGDPLGGRPVLAAVHDRGPHPVARLRTSDASGSPTRLYDGTPTPRSASTSTR